MTPPALQLLTTADSSGWRTCVEKSREERGEAGQFFTPPSIASHLAGWFSEKSLNQPIVNLLDPGAGGGVLTAALVDRITGLRVAGVLPFLKEVRMVLWEADKAFIPALDANLAACSSALHAVGIRSTGYLHHASYIEGAVNALNEGLFENRHALPFTHAILNPPYHKIATRSRERALLTSVGIETTNLYAAFVWLALRQLGSSGELAAITPRSFCNGPYFRDFRRELFDLATFSRVHVFDSRTEAFSRDAVLQENILFHLCRNKRLCRAITIASGSLANPTELHIPTDHFVHEADPDKVIHIATETDADEVRAFIQSLPCKLEQLGLEVSTGPVVDFRLKASLSRKLRENEVPLIYPHCVKGGCVHPPRDDADDYGDRRLGKKPIAIALNDETRRWLIPPARFVLIKRFSAKEEKRRLVAGVLEPSDFPYDLIGIENHVNFFHHKRTGLPAAVASGLCRFLNSTVADRYFRQFNGHTQVNASDLRAFRFPDLPTLERLGKATLDDADTSAIDLAMTKLLGAPTFP
jgi:adenine-specific DNA-methyltransferase